MLHARWFSQNQWRAALHSVIYIYIFVFADPSACGLAQSVVWFLQHPGMRPCTVLYFYFFIFLEPPECCPAQSLVWHARLPFAEPPARGPAGDGGVAGGHRRLLALPVLPPPAEAVPVAQPSVRAVLRHARQSAVAPLAHLRPAAAPAHAADGEWRRWW